MLWKRTIWSWNRIVVQVLQCQSNSPSNENKTCRTCKGAGEMHWYLHSELLCFWQSIVSYIHAADEFQLMAHTCPCVIQTHWFLGWLNLPRKFYIFPHRAEHWNKLRTQVLTSSWGLLLPVLPAVKKSTCGDHPTIYVAATFCPPLSLSLSHSFIKSKLGVEACSISCLIYGKKKKRCLHCWSCALAFFDLLSLEDVQYLSVQFLHYSAPG